MLALSTTAVFITLPYFIPQISDALTMENAFDDQQNETRYELVYFNARLRAEGARLIFAQAGVPYEDIRITKEEWPKLKPNTPFGHLPVLRFDGNELAESFAINRYLARQFGLAGNDSLEEAYVDSIADFFKDFFDGTRKAVEEIADGGSLGKEYNEIIIPARGAFLPPLERFLEKANSGYVVGTSVTWADLVITEYLATCDSIINGFLDDYPKINEYVNHIRNLPNIKKWIDERPQSNY